MSGAVPRIRAYARARFFVGTTRAGNAQPTRRREPTEPLGVRAAWLERLVHEYDAFDKQGRLRFDVRDPQTGEVHTAARDHLIYARSKNA